MARSYTLKSSPKPDGAAGGLDYASLLNEQQLEAVTSKPGAALVIAGAGSGKTRTLTYRVAYLLEKGYKPYNILLLTFTNKAAGEMLTRVGQLVPQDMHGIWGGYLPRHWQSHSSQVRRIARIHLRFLHHGSRGPDQPDHPGA